MTRSDVLEKEHIVLMSPADGSNGEAFELKSIADIEKVHIKKVLDRVRWNKQEASRILDITRPTLNAKIEKYGLKHN